MRAAGRVVHIDRARDILLRARDSVPLRIFRGVREKPQIAAGSEVGVVVHVRREDIPDVPVLVLEQGREQHSVGHATVRIGRHLGNRKDRERPVARVEHRRPGLWIEQTERIGGYRGDRDQQEQQYRSNEPSHLVRTIAASDTPRTSGSRRLCAFKAPRVTGFESTINLRRIKFAVKSSVTRLPLIPVFACLGNVQGFVPKNIFRPGWTWPARAATSRGH